MALRLLLSLFTVFAVAKAKFSAKIEFFRDAYLENRHGVLGFSKANRCFNLDCADLNDAVSSAKWSGLPPATTDAFIPQMGFYADSDCKGQRMVYPAELGGVLTFSSTWIEGKVSSFMLQQDSTRIKDGTQSVCDVKPYEVYNATTF